MFVPPFCPYPACSAHRSPPFRWNREGSYTRKCDGRQVPRFRCLECRRTCSSQSFRLDRGLKRPQLTGRVLRAFVSKMTQRQFARIEGCNRKLVPHRLRLLGLHCREFHTLQMTLARRRGTLSGTFQLDELETFAHNRRLAPLTVPVLIHRSTYFICATEVGDLPCRGNLKEADRLAKAQREDRLGKRRSQSKMCVETCLKTLGPTDEACASITIQSDRKASYGPAILRTLGTKTTHSRFSSTAKRNYSNPLFPINHTLAMLRDGLSRLVRRSWAASKNAVSLARHLSIWVAWRNYVRSVTNKAPSTTPAMALGVTDTPWTIRQLIAKRVFLSRFEPSA